MFRKFFCYCTFEGKRILSFFHLFFSFFPLFFLLKNSILYIFVFFIWVGVCTYIILNMLFFFRHLGKESWCKSFKRFKILTFWNYTLNKQSYGPQKGCLFESDIEWIMLIKGWFFSIWQRMLWLCGCCIRIGTDRMDWY